MARKGNGKCIDFSDWLADGENPNGMVNVGAYGTQRGVEPRDLVGRQGWGSDLLGGEGEMGSALGPDWGLSEADKEKMYGPMPAMTKVTPGKPRKK